MGDEKRCRTVDASSSSGYVKGACRAAAALLRESAVSDHVSACAGCGELRPGGGGGGKRAIVAAKLQAAAPRLRPHPHRAAPCCRG